ncbi:hypothetical protein NP493_1325g01052 [Ridgeia piscesae]|uniref:Uncharacterized protein n=1 Tax=Ridgeia piscesae TaxID=27915 RepID=A0AAD9NF83_RIDPI|nr:hypothetical protein NP493_1325g01052 [Ridgeia piscesae]
MDGPKNEDQTYVSVRIEFRSPHVARIRFRRAAFSGAECTYIRRNTSRPLSGPQIFSLLRVNVKGCGFTMIRGSTESTIPARCIYDSRRVWVSYSVPYCRHSTGHRDFPGQRNGHVDASSAYMSRCLLPTAQPRQYTPLPH